MAWCTGASALHRAHSFSGTCAAYVHGRMKGSRWHSRLSSAALQQRSAAEFVVGLYPGQDVEKLMGEGGKEKGKG